MRAWAVLLVGFLALSGCVTGPAGDPDANDRGIAPPGCEAPRETPTATGTGPHASYRSKNWARQNITFEFHGSGYEVHLPLPLSDGARPADWAEVLAGDLAWRVDGSVRVEGDGPARLHGCIVRADCCVEAFLQRQWVPDENGTVAEVVTGHASVAVRYEADSHHCWASDAWSIEGGPGVYEVSTGGPRGVCT